MLRTFDSHRHTDPNIVAHTSIGVHLLIVSDGHDEFSVSKLIEGTYSQLKQVTGCFGRCVAQFGGSCCFAASCSRFLRPRKSDIIPSSTTLLDRTKSGIEMLLSSQRMINVFQDQGLFE